MSFDGTEPPCYLAEWYRPELTVEPLECTVAKLHASAAVVTAAGSPVHLINMIAVPTDEVLFGVFTAEHVALVAQTCRRAGIPAQRLTSAIDAHIAATNP